MINPTPHNDSERPTAPGFHPELIILEALRIAHSSTGSEHYRVVHEQLRTRIAARINEGEHRDSAASPALAKLPERPPSESPALGASANALESMPIRVVCATRADRQSFYSTAPLGRSLSLHLPPHVDVRLFSRNTHGLSTIYNTVISESAEDNVILLFIHDDVHLCDHFWAQRLREGLSVFDVVGLAGSCRRHPGQPGWGFTDEMLTPETRDNCSGAVAHGTGFPPNSIDVFGPSRRKVALLDGLFLAARSDTLRRAAVRFDERFDFHFYDLDFCRQVEKAGLTMGTWPISVVHESKGSYLKGAWRLAYARYLEKWGQ